jgi:hypothetical protein
MPHPYVTNVTLRDGQIVLTVRVDDFVGDDSVEISGYATQNGGAFASFYDIQPITENPDGTRVVYVKATPSQGFNNGEAVTVSLRAARVWVTVLTEGPEITATYGDTGPAQEGTTWNNPTSMAWATPGSSSKWSDGQASAGSDSSFRHA